MTLPGLWQNVLLAWPQIQNPELEYGVQSRESTTCTSEFGNQNPKQHKTQTLKFRTQTLQLRIQNFHVRTMKLGPRTSPSESRSQNMGVQNQGPEDRPSNPQPRSWSSEPVTQHQGNGAQGLECAQDLVARIQSPEQALREISSVSLLFPSLIALPLPTNIFWSTQCQAASRKQAEERLSSPCSDRSKKARTTSALSFMCPHCLSGACGRCFPNAC